MTATVDRLIGMVTLSTLLGLLTPVEVRAQTASARYGDAQTRDQKVRRSLDQRDATADPTVRTQVITEARAVIAAYVALVRRYPSSGYSDNALSNAGDLAATLFQQFGDPQDRDAAIRSYKRVAAEYPASSLIQRTEPLLVRLLTTPAAPPVAPERSSRAKLTAIERTVLPNVVRITLALDREVPYREETLIGPARLFFDLRGVETAPELVDAVLRYPSEAVRQIRVGRHPNSTVRVVLDLEGVARHSVYPLYNPFRVVIDCEPVVGIAAKTVAPPVAPVITPRPIVPPSPAATAPLVSPRPTTVSEPVIALPARPTTPPETPAPAPETPTTNRAGGFSIARQLGLGVSRIVIDPGHGGHDPGAQANGLGEADLTLDIALRLEQLLDKEPGLEVVLTRRTNVYVPLEERTAMANREAADLFLSIHANASRNASARGVETYFLSFASTPEAEAVAARENSAHAGEMRNLPDIIKTIALNNKLDESRDLAGMVQEALVTRLRRSNKNVRNLGVKKAPFVVLIGASMPSVLAEVSFLTNKQELQLLKSAAYKQRIAEALHAAVMRYRRSLKGQGAVAMHE